MENDPRTSSPGQRGARRGVSAERKALYYFGIALMVIGFVLFLSVFFSGFAMMGSDPFRTSGNPGGLFGRGLVGMLLLIAGRLMMNAGARGLAGSGVVLDPEQTRDDLEPWARAGGGLVRDALDEANLDLGGKQNEPPGLSFDEKLRRLEQLRKDGLLSEAEYRQKREELLKQPW